jgi:magnesium transporter
VELEPESQEMLINGFSNTELTEVLDELYLDDAVDIVEEMPASVVIRILDKATPEMRKSINEILKYPEDSAGSIMNMEFLSLKKDMTVEDAFKRIRRIGGELETINILYVTDPTRHLLGVLSVRDLLLAEEDDLIEEIMDPDVVWAKTTDDKEDVAQALSKYDFLAMPIVDLEKRLVGIVTVDDAMDVIEEETTEDFEKMAAMLPSDKPYLRTGVFATWKARLPWLMVLMLSATFTGMILNHYENALAACLVLNAYIPMLSGTGGNSGTQASVALSRIRMTTLAGISSTMSTASSRYNSSSTSVSSVLEKPLISISWLSGSSSTNTSAAVSLGSRRYSRGICSCLPSSSSRAISAGSMGRNRSRSSA